MQIITKVCVVVLLFFLAGCSTTSVFKDKQQFERSTRHVLLMNIVNPSLTLNNKEHWELKTYIRTLYPREISNNGALITYFIKHLGYSIDANCFNNHDMLNQIPVATTRIKRTMPVLDFIQGVVGDSYIIVVDPDNKLIAFKPKE